MKNSFNNSDRKWFRPVFWGLVLVLVAVVLILDGIGISSFGYTIGAWRIIVGVLLLAWLAYALVSFHFADIFIPLAILFLVFEGPIAHAMGREDDNLISNWTVILAAVLLTIGFNIILKPIHTVSINGKEYETVRGAGRKHYGNQAVYFEADKLDGTVIHDHMGEVQIFIKNAASYPGGAVVTIADNLGKIVLHIPDEWDVVSQTSDNLGSVVIPAHTGTGEKNITLVIKDNLGSIQVEFDKQ